MSNAFYTTRDLFNNYMHYDSPLSYEQWLAIADDNKAAYLYVRFFDQITLAWYKVKSFYTLEEDAVSTVLQYLLKNVPLIEADKKRFNAGYIYRVAYNCLYCICHDYQKDRLRYETECSNIVECGEDTLDLFDTVSDGDSTWTELLNSIDGNKFWSIIEEMGEDAEAIVSKLLSPDLPLPSHLRSIKKREAIIQELREKLAQFREEYNY